MRSKSGEALFGNVRSRYKVLYGLGLERINQEGKSIFLSTFFLVLYSALPATVRWIESVKSLGSGGMGVDF